MDIWKWNRQLIYYIIRADSRVVSIKVSDVDKNMKYFRKLILGKWIGIGLLSIFLYAKTILLCYNVL